MTDPRAPSTSVSPGRPINLVFLGCGLITGFHSRWLARHRRDVHCFYASRDMAKARACHQHYHGGGFFDGYDTALCDPRIEVAVVATPPSTHLDLTLRALQAGKNVIVEKPAFLTSSDFDVIRRVQAETGRRVFVAENYFYKPLTMRLREIVASGMLGEILFVYINAMKYQRTENWRDDARLAGGGALFEGGVHWINLLANLGLTISSVHGMRVGPPQALERTMLVGVRYAEGAAGLLAHSWETPAPFRVLRLSKIYGRQGSVTFESNGLMVLVNSRRKQLIFPSLTDVTGHRAMWQDFIYCLRSGAEPRMTLQLAQRDLALIEAVYRSADQPLPMSR